jgi:hypothetical protein
MIVTSSLSEDIDTESKWQCGDPENKILLCKIFSIKTQIIDGHMIKLED